MLGALCIVHVGGRVVVVGPLEKGVLCHFTTKVDKSDRMIEEKTMRINRAKENSLQKCELVSPVLVL